MTTLGHVRTAVKRLAEVARVEGAGSETWAVDGREFLSVTADRTAVELHLPVDDAEKVVVDIPGASLTEGEGRATVSVPLEAMNGMQANAVIGRAWAHRAPGRLTQVSARAASAGGDLPRSIGRPATSALHGAGIATLAELSTRSRAEVAGLHGIGPKALGLLDEALGAVGRRWS